MQLERMKNENSLLLQDDNDFDQKFPGLQSEFMKLQKVSWSLSAPFSVIALFIWTPNFLLFAQANEELGTMFPLFNEFSGCGNALERVLALEIELAEALQAKKRSSILFQRYAPQSSCENT
jgi:hypothetical protein